MVNRNNQLSHIKRLDSISNIFRAHVELAIFLTLMLGFLLGKIRIGNFKVGVMLGCLIAGVIVGQMNISIPAVTKIIFFDLFLWVILFLYPMA